MQSVANIDILTLGTGKYYATTCTNLPAGWAAAYLDVERLDSQWCRITAWPPYKGLDTPYITKQSEGAWQGWKTILTNADIKYKRVLVNNTVDGYGYITDSDVTASSIIVANTEGVGAVYITGSYVTGNNITFWFNEKNTGQYYVKYAILNL